MSPTAHPEHPNAASPRRTIKAVALVLARHEIRSLRRWFEDFDRDILLPILLGEIALHNIGALQNGVARRESTRPITATPSVPRDTRPADCGLKPCNAYSIAAATGLPRETVRRKIGRLEELGWVTRVPEGGVVVSGRCIDHTYETTYPETFFELLETYSHLRRHLPEKWFE